MAKILLTSGHALRIDQSVVDLMKSYNAERGSPDLYWLLRDGAVRIRFDDVVGIVEDSVELG